MQSHGKNVSSVSRIIAVVASHSAVKDRQPGSFCRWSGCVIAVAWRPDVVGTQRSTLVSRQQRLHWHSSARFYTLSSRRWSTTAGRWAERVNCEVHQLFSLHRTNGQTASRVWWRHRTSHADGGWCVGGVGDDPCLGLAWLQASLCVARSLQWHHWRTGRQ